MHLVKGDIHIMLFTLLYKDTGNGETELEGATAQTPQKTESEEKAENCKFSVCAMYSWQSRRLSSIREKKWSELARSDHLPCARGVGDRVGFVPKMSRKTILKIFRRFVCFPCFKSFSLAILTLLYGDQ